MASQCLLCRKRAVPDVVSFNSAISACAPWACTASKYACKSKRLLRFGTFQVAVIQHTKTLTSKLRIMGRTQFYHQCTSRIKDSKAQVPQAKPQTQPSKTLIHVPMIGEHQRPTIGLKPCSSLQRYAGPSSRLVRRPQKAVCRVLAGEGRNSRGGSRRKIHGSSISAVFDKDASPLDFSREAQSVCCASPLWCLSQIDAVAHSAKLQRTFTFMEIWEAVRRSPTSEVITYNAIISALEKAEDWPRAALQMIL